MIKILKIFFVSLILIFFVSLTYLSIFGIETNRFNKLISDKIRNIHPEIDVKLKKIKLTIELFELKVLIVTKNPVIEISNKKLNLKKVSTAYNIKSFFKKDLGITNLNIGTHRKPEIIEQIAPFSVNLSQNIARIITGQNVAAIPDQPKITNQNIVLVGEMSDTLTATIKEIIASVRVICFDSLIKESGFAFGLRIC